MMQLVAQAGHFHAAEDVRIGFGAGIDVDDRDRVRLLPGRIECGHIGEFFSRRLHGHARRRIKARIGSPSHGILPACVSGGNATLARPVLMQAPVQAAYERAGRRNILPCRSHTRRRRHHRRAESQSSVQARRPRVLRAHEAHESHPTFRARGYPAMRAYGSRIPASAIRAKQRTAVGSTRQACSLPKYTVRCCRSARNSRPVRGWLLGVPALTHAISNESL